MRKLGKPPFLITLIMDAVIILFRKRIDPIKPDPDKQFLLASWAESLKVMGSNILHVMINSFCFLLLYIFFNIYRLWPMLGF